MTRAEYEEHSEEMQRLREAFSRVWIDQVTELVAQGMTPNELMGRQHEAWRTFRQERGDAA